MKIKLHPINAKWLLAIFIVLNAYAFIQVSQAYMFDILQPVHAKPIVVEVRQDLPKTYAYNERVPEEIILEEIKLQAEQFGLDAEMMIELAKCESGLNNLAKNPNSTALGIYQYLIKTWEETESFINERRARTDYKANIREAMLDVANGEVWRWQDCGKKLGLIK